MDGRNSTGARISLLNDSAGAAAESKASASASFGPGPRRPTSLAHFHYSSGSYLHSSHSTYTSSTSTSTLNSRSHSYSQRPSLSLSHSRTSSFTSTPILSSPPTPQLVRSDSSDSQQSRSYPSFLSRQNSKMDLEFDLGLRSLNRTPSPITPVGLGFDALNAQLTGSPDGTIKSFNDPQINVGPFTHPQPYLPSIDPLVDQKVPTTSTSPRSVTSLHQYPALTSRQPQGPFAYPTLPHQQPVMQPSMGPQLPLYPPQHSLAQVAHQQPMPLPPQQQQQQQPQQQQSPTAASANGTGASAKQPGKKNQYPCPLAKEYSCNNFFTTSGHAARHAKKHTGKKDAYCPECNKAFTRKDNMEQHRRTHQNGRNASKASGSTTSSATSTTVTEGAPATKRQKTSDESSPLDSNKRPKIMPIQPFESNPSPTAIDPSLPISPASSFGFSESVGLPVQMPPQAYPAELLQQAVFGTQTSPYPNPNGPYYDSHNMSGLDKLAMAASASNEGSRSGSL